MLVVLVSVMVPSAWLCAQTTPGPEAPPVPSVSTPPPAPRPEAEALPSSQEAASPAEAVPTDPADEETETELTLTDGSRVSGVLVERTPDRIVLKINGIRTAYAAESVAHVETKPPVVERYRQMRASIDDGDLDQRMRLAEWLRVRKKYQLALDEVSGILGRDPRNVEAQQLRVWLNEQLKLRAKPGARTQPGDAPPPQPEMAIAPQRGFPLLSPDQINLIRVFEVDLADPPRMMIDRDVITGLINKYAGDPLIPAGREGREAIYRKTPAQVLDLMFRLRAREFYGRVQVMQDPRSMKLFRERIHAAWLMNSCATAQCHGGEAAGRLYLATRQPNSDATVYTNFLILDRFRLSPAAPRDAAPEAKEQAPIALINFEDPAQSPLLQLAMNRTESRFPHPQVAAAGGRLKPVSTVFHSVNDRRFQDAVDWIKSMYTPRPDYPVQYTPPRPGEVAAGVLGGARGGKKDKADPLGPR